VSLRTSFLLTLLLMACSKETASVRENLASDARRALVERDKRLNSYLVAALTTQGDQTATHTFVARGHRVKGTLLTPQPMTLSFDGTRFFKLSPAEKKLEVFELKLPAEKAALFLTTQFSPFVPEGYRTPLLPTKGVTATKVAHPKGPEAFELTVSTHDETGTPITVRYQLRFPNGDFLGKTTQAGTATSELIVEAEQCDATRGLCVPKVVLQRENGVELGRTHFTRIELEPDIPNDEFSLTSPEGYTFEKHELVESGALVK
jgi:outer membrane lipoprotein-sorting protein